MCLVFCLCGVRGRSHQTENLEGEGSIPSAGTQTRKWGTTQFILLSCFLYYFVFVFMVDCERGCGNSTTLSIY